MTTGRINLLRQGSDTIANRGTVLRQYLQGAQAVQMGERSPAQHRQLVSAQIPEMEDTVSAQRTVRTTDMKK